MEKVTVDDVELVLTRPVDQELEWIGGEELVDQILAAWLVVGEKDLPLCPRLIGKPGVGKTTLGYAAARRAGLAAYIHQCTVDTRPEDLLVTPVLSRDGKISYHASPLVSAMVKGGAVVLDEANRMSEKSWASLAPLLDHRRYVESVVAGVRIPAHPAFRACITMNDDASTYEIPDYMLSRIQPAVALEFPDKEEEFRILRYHLPFAPEEILALTVDFLQEAHRFGLGHSTRDGINIARYSIKLGRLQEDRRIPEKDAASLQELFERATRRILGEDAFDFEKHALRKEAPKFLDLREFFEQVDVGGEEPEEEGSSGDEEAGGAGEAGGEPDEPRDDRRGPGKGKGGKPRSRP